MSILYVSKSGSDSNSGASYLLSKLTISAAVTIAANSDTIIVGSGLYNEKISYTAKNVYFFADGVVVIDGTGIASNPAFATGTGGIQLDIATTGGQWIIQNHVATYLITTVAGNPVNNCIFLSNANTGVVSTSSSQYACMFNRCVFSGFTTVFINTSGVAAAYFYNCTFYNGTTGIYLGAGGANLAGLIVSLCVFSNFTTAWNFRSTSPSSLLYTNDNLYYNITNWIIGFNICTTLAQVQAVNPNYDSRSLVADPQFTDVTSNIFYLKAQSSVSPYVGAYPYSFTQGATNDSLGKWNIIAGNGFDNSGWYLPSGSNIVKNISTGYFELTSGTVDAIWSPVYDLGNSYPITKINLESNQTWPTNMVDQTKTDVRPNRQSLSVRASASSFAQNDAVIAWTEVYQNLPMTTINGRYVQLRLTLRMDDVGA